MSSLYVSLVNSVARLLHAVQRPARSTNGGVDTNWTGESRPAGSVSYYELQSPSESIVYNPSGPSLPLPTSPAPTYTSRADFENLYGSHNQRNNLLTSGIFPNDVASAHEEVTARPPPALEPIRGTLRSLVRWNGRRTAHDAEMQLAVSSSSLAHTNMSAQIRDNERPPTYVEVDPSTSSQVAPRRRRVAQAAIVFSLTASITIAFMVTFLKTKNAF
ncbi:unnamed protein product [Peniophora sp. CBMAI 1063]|nr:unnamed protein product [Peniophora sp. CBMAI 1063]